MSDTAVKIDAKLVKELREKSGAPMGDCLKALQEVKGDMEEAFVVLRKRGMASAAKKASRTTNEGAVGTYIHAGGKIGVLVELNCESDFVARTPDFQELLRDIAMHIAATDPRYVRREDVTAEDLEREKEIYRAQAAATGKPANIIEKMLEGKMGKFYEEVCLLDQPFIKEQTQTIAQIIATKVAKLGENISVRRFARFKVGEPNWTVATTAQISSEEASGIGQLSTPQDNRARATARALIFASNAMSAEGATQPGYLRLQPAASQKGSTHIMQYIDNIPVWGTHEENTLEQAKLCARSRRLHGAYGRRSSWLWRSDWRRHRFGESHQPYCCRL